jgi:hypothetical protein
MPQNFIFPQRDQPMLMPVDMREWLPEDDLVFVVLDAVATLELGEFRADTGPTGTGGRQGEAAAGAAARRWTGPSALAGTCHTAVS